MMSLDDLGEFLRSITEMRGSYSLKVIFLTYV